jgi:hypothetical protein
MFLVLRHVRKIAISDCYLCRVCLSVCLSAWNLLDHHCTGLRAIWCFRISRKFVDKFKFHWLLTRITGYFAWRPVYIYDNIFWVVLTMRDVSEKFADKITSTHFMSNKFSPENRAVYKRGRAGQASDDDIIWRLRYACWITKATDTHTEYVIVLIAFPRQHWLRERVSMLRLYVHCLSCFCLPQLFVRNWLWAQFIGEFLDLRGNKWREKGLNFFAGFALRCLREALLGSPSSSGWPGERHVGYHALEWWDNEN